MFSKLLELLESAIGKQLLLLLLVFVVGIVSMQYLPRFLVTTEAFNNDKTEIFLAMEAGDNVNAIEIVNLQLNDARNEKMKLQNFIDIQQQGKCNDSQRRRLDELSTMINKLELRREHIYNSFKKRSGLNE